MHHRTVATALMVLLSVAAVRAKAADMQPGVLDFVLGMTMGQVKQTLQKHPEFKAIEVLNGLDQATGQPFPIALHASALLSQQDLSEVRQSDVLLFHFSPPWDDSKLMGIERSLVYRGNSPAKGAPLPPSVLDLEAALLQRYGNDHYVDIVGNLAWVWPMDPLQMSADDFIAKCLISGTLASKQLFQPREGCGRLVQVAFNNSPFMKTRAFIVNSHVIDYPAIVDVQKRALQMAADTARKAAPAAGQPTGQPDAKPAL